MGLEEHLDELKLKGSFMFLKHLEVFCYNFSRNVR